MYRGLRIPSQMEIEKVRLSTLKPDKTYRLSFPIRPDSGAAFIQKFPHFPSLIITEDNRIVFGIDNYYFYKSNNQKEAVVFRIRIAKKDALFLNFNLKDKFFGCNLYEKLVFLKKIIPGASVKEIYEKANLALPINPEVLEKLPVLTGAEFKSLLIHDRISLNAALKICEFQKKNRLPIIQLFETVHFSSSNQLSVIDMIEEINFREKAPVENIFKKLNLKNCLLTEKPQEKILEQILSFRYPEYQKTEKKWKTEIKKLKLPSNIKVNHSRFFEKKQIGLTIQLQNLQDIKELIERLKIK